MKLKRVTISNFRGIKGCLSLDFEDITAIVGRNDVGKSTFLEALDIFFNGSSAQAKMSIDDINREIYMEESDQSKIEISCEFSNVSGEIVLDESEKTTFKREGLLIDDVLRVVKVYGPGNFGKSHTYVECHDLYGEEGRDIFTLKNDGLKKLARKLKIDTAKMSSNKSLRSEIRRSARCDRLAIKRFEFAGDRLLRLEMCFPRYELFRADRENDSTDSDVQNPLRAVIKSVFENSEIKNKLERIAERITYSLQQELHNMLAVLQDYDQNLVTTLRPTLPAVDSLKWWEIFKTVTLLDDNGVSLDKRGSGIRRMVLMSFLQAQAKKELQNDSCDVLYAIEEPETAQHTDSQIKIIESLVRLSSHEHVQIILTTHSGTVLKELRGHKIWILSKIASNVECNDTSCNKKFRPVFEVPSVVEISYLNLGDCVIEYHEELYGFLQINGLVGGCDGWCKQKGSKYCKEFEWPNETKKKVRGLPHYVRDLLHHPENEKNEKCSDTEIKHSISIIREYLFDKGFDQLKKKNERNF